jgi:hypothetical protein
MLRYDLEEVDLGLDLNKGSDQNHDSPLARPR